MDLTTETGAHILTCAAGILKIAVGLAKDVEHVTTWFEDEKRRPERDATAEHTAATTEVKPADPEKVEKLRKMTVEHGCTPEEAATAQAIADEMEGATGNVDFS